MFGDFGDFISLYMYNDSQPMLYCHQFTVITSLMSLQYGSHYYINDKYLVNWSPGANIYTQTDHM